MSDQQGGRFVVWARDRLNRFRGSLFGVPAIWVVGAVILSLVIVSIDRESGDISLPGGFTSTVDSSRALLGAITSGTIASASVVFSLTLVAIQLASSSYSSRVVRTFLRDRFQQNVIGLVTGTFAYSMLVLRAIRGPLEEGGDPFVPRFSILIATGLALASLLGLIGSINHTAQNLRVTTITRQLVAELKKVIAQSLPLDSNNADLALQAPRETPNRPAPGAGAPGDDPFALSGVAAAVLTSKKAGWVQQISLRAIRDAVAEGSSIRIEVAPGTYVFADAPLLTVSPPPTGDGAEHQQDLLRGAFAIGSERSLQQDISFGLILLEDIAVRALSPGVNDPNTANAVIPQLGEVVLDILSRPLRPVHDVYANCAFYRPSEPTYDDYVDSAFAQIQHYAAGQRAVVATLVRTLHTVGDELYRRHRASDAAVGALTAALDRIDADVGRPDYAPSELAELRQLMERIEWWERGG